MTQILNDRMPLELDRQPDFINAVNNYSCMLTTK